MKVLKNEEYVYRDCNIRMSTKAMANLLYAAIITQAGLPTSYGIGIYDYNRNQNAYNTVDIKVHIHPSMIGIFEKYSGVKLKKPVGITINNNTKSNKQETKSYTGRSGLRLVDGKYRENWSPDWQGDPDDPLRWKGW